MEEKINKILREYTNCFKDMDCSPLKASQFKIRFDFNNKNLFGSLIFMDRAIYKQRKILKELSNLYQDNKENLQELRQRLLNVHKEIFKVLQQDFRIDQCWVDPKTDQIEYLEY